MPDATAELLKFPLYATQTAEHGLLPAWYPDGGTLAYPESGLRTGKIALYQAIIDWTASGITGEGIGIHNLINSMIGFVDRTPAILRFAVSSSRVAWTEFCNKAEAFWSFATADLILAPSPRYRLNLPAATARAATMEPYRGLWTTEGLGFYCASAALKSRVAPRQILSTESVSLPNKSLVPLHTGMGLAFALQQLQTVNRNNQWTKLDSMLHGFISLCRENSVDGYFGAAFEAIGLVARLVRPEMLVPIDRVLRDTDVKYAACFWHGVGRGLYFSPANVLPCTSIAWPAIAKAYSEPTDELGRQNAIAGLAWAVTLVNIRNPDVIEAFIQQHDVELSYSDAFANGISSASAIWHDWAPDTPELRRFCDHQPKPSDVIRLDQWNRFAQGHCENQLARNDGPLKRGQQLDRLFRYEPIRE